MDHSGDFYNAYRRGFARVAACTDRTTLADSAANAESVLALARECHDDGVPLAVFPELTLSGYSIDDIVQQDSLLSAVEAGLHDVVAASTELLPVLIVGAPLHWLKVFVQRLYSFSQFKRSALPNGSRVSHGGSLSPRGKWRAPSDMSVAEERRPIRI